MSNITPHLCRRDGKARGLVSITPQMREAYDLFMAGHTQKEIAELYGKSRSTINMWLEKVREHDEDERNMREMGR